MDGHEVASMRMTESAATQQNRRTLDGLKRDLMAGRGPSEGRERSANKIAALWQRRRLRRAAR
jgi:hypothetical protein